MSRLKAPIAETASVPESSKEALRASPPLSTSRMLLCGASCIPMLRLLVTTVSRRRPLIARETASVVVPPVSPTSESSGTSSAAASAIRRFSAACWEARSPIGVSTKPPGLPTRAPRSRDRALLLEHDRVAPDRGGRDRQLLGEPFDGDRLLGRLDQVDDRAQPLVATRCRRTRSRVLPHAVT